MLDKETSREVRSKIRNTLISEWDPIALNDVPEAVDEYDAYIGGVYELLAQDAPEERIFEYLRTIEIESMEMVDASGEPLLPEKIRRVAAASLKALGRDFR